MKKIKQSNKTNTITCNTLKAENAKQMYSYKLRGVHIRKKQQPQYTNSLRIKTKKKIKNKKIENKKNTFQILEARTIWLFIK